ncbi:MAG: hypothetical protein ACOX7F_03525 [Eubacteriales bacterium]|jgi:hypothetical protein
MQKAYHPPAYFLCVPPCPRRQEGFYHGRNSNHPEAVKAALNQTITAALKRLNYRVTSDKAFTRDRALTLEIMIRLLFSTSGGSLQKELH